MFLFQAGTSLEGRVTQILIELNSLEIGTRFHLNQTVMATQQTAPDGELRIRRTTPTAGKAGSSITSNHFRGVEITTFQILFRCVEGIINRLQIGGIPMRPTSRAKTWQTE